MKENIFGLVATTVLGIVVIFGAAPVLHYAGVWWDKWNSDAPTITSSISDSTDYSAYQKRYDQAQADCNARAQKHFNSPLGSGYASSTSGTGFSDDSYKTYTCSGLLFVDLPATK